MLQRQPLMLSIALALLVAAGAYLWFSQSYGEVSRNGYEFATALFSAVNQQDKPRLLRIADMVQQSHAAGKLRSDDADWLVEIVELGLDGEWTAANRNIRQLMEDQVREVHLD